MKIYNTIHNYLKAKAGNYVTNAKFIEVTNKDGGGSDNLENVIEANKPDADKIIVTIKDERLGCAPMSVTAFITVLIIKIIQLTQFVASHGGITKAEANRISDVNDLDFKQL